MKKNKSQNKVTNNKQKSPLKSKISDAKLKKNSTSSLKQESKIKKDPKKNVFQKQSSKFQSNNESSNKKQNDEKKQKEPLENESKEKNEISKIQNSPERKSPNKKQSSIQKEEIPNLSPKKEKKETPENSEIEIPLKLDKKEEIIQETIKIVPEKPEKERNKNIRVYVRFRPFNIIETELLNSGDGFETPEYEKNEIVRINTHKNKNENTNAPLFKFDKVFKSDTPQIEIYDIVGKEIVKDVMDGYNGTIFAYGQSGSGKTFTMYGKDIDDEETKGLIPRIVEEIFNGC